MMPVGNKQLLKVMNSNGVYEKRIKLQEEANHSLENYPLFCREKAAKQKNFDNFEHLKCK